jgi:hypothetical protein
MPDKPTGRKTGRKASAETSVKTSAETSVEVGAKSNVKSAQSARAASSADSANQTLGPRTPGMAWIERMREFRGRRERDLTLGLQLGQLEREFRARQREVGDLVDVWLEVAPPRLREMVSIGGLSQGTLTLVTASSAAGFEASRALREGLERTLMARFPARVRRVKVKVGGS